MYLVSYDISNDKIRKKIADKLLGYGNRVQYSVFECKIDGNKYRKLLAELQILMQDVVQGSIRIYYMDREAAQSIMIIGDKDYTDTEESVFFI